MGWCSKSLHAGWNAFSWRGKRSNALQLLGRINWLLLFSFSMSMYCGGITKCPLKLHILRDNYLVCGSQQNLGTRKWDTGNQLCKIPVKCTVRKYRIFQLFTDMQVQPGNAISHIWVLQVVTWGSYLILFFSFKI